MNTFVQYLLKGLLLSLVVYFFNMQRFTTSVAWQFLWQTVALAIALYIIDMIFPTVFRLQLGGGCGCGAAKPQIGGSCGVAAAGVQPVGCF